MHGFHLEKYAASSAPQRAGSSGEKTTSDQHARPTVRFEAREPPVFRFRQLGVVKHLKKFWNKLTRADRNVEPSASQSTHSRPLRISNPLRSTVASLALASFDDVRHLGHPKVAETNQISIPVTIDGAIVDHITLPAELASRIVGADIAQAHNAWSIDIQLTTQTPPTYEQAHAPAPVPSTGNQSFKACRLFSDETIQLAGWMFASAEPLVIWPAPSNLYNQNADRLAVNAIRRNIRMAPGNMIQMPSIYNTGDSYMLGYESSKPDNLPFSRTRCTDPRLFVALPESDERGMSCCRAFILSDTSEPT